MLSNPMDPLSGSACAMKATSWSSAKACFIAGLHSLGWTKANTSVGLPFRSASTLVFAHCSGVLKNDQRCRTVFKISNISNQWLGNSLLNFGLAQIDRLVITDGWYLMEGPVWDSPPKYAGEITQAPRKHAAKVITLLWGSRGFMATNKLATCMDRVITPWILDRVASHFVGITTPSSM